VVAPNAQPKEVGAAGESLSAGGHLGSLNDFDIFVRILDIYIYYICINIYIHIYICMYVYYTNIETYCMYV
jgi:hypothetical protein